MATSPDKGDLVPFTMEGEYYFVDVSNPSIVARAHHDYPAEVARARYSIQDITFHKLDTETRVQKHYYVHSELGIAHRIQCLGPKFRLSFLTL